jgi:transketolase
MQGATERTDLLALVSAYEQGELERDAYWSKMRGEHARLEAYTRLCGRGDLASIEIHADGLQVVYRDGLRMRFRPEDTRSVPSVTVNHGSYEPAESRALLALAADARVILDIGANAGFVALRLARAVQDRAAVVHAFEPVPSTFSELCQNLSLNATRARVVAHPFALGESRGQVTFYVPAFQGSVAASAQPLFTADDNRAVEVDMTTLDEFAAREGLERIDLVKCDVEGAELFVLRGGMQTLSRTRPVLMLEMLRKWARAHGYHPNAILALLAPLGYRCFSLGTDGLVEHDQIDESTAPTNFFFLDPVRHARELARLGGAESIEPRPNARATQRLARAVRAHVLKMTHDSRASHVGSCLSIADILAVLYGDVLRVDPAQPARPERDRFVLSKGHAAAALYAVLAERGFFPKEWLDDYCADGSRLAGHVIHHGVPGVEVSTGSLGHGLNVATGMALAAKRSGASYRVYALLSDGECDEGSTWEAALFAPHHHLDNLTAIIDANGIQSFGSVSEVLELEPFADKWRAFGWHVVELDGHDHAALAAAFERRAANGKPTVVLARTVKGKGVSFMENQLLWHYRSPDAAELARALDELGAGA